MGIAREPEPLFLPTILIGGTQVFLARASCRRFYRPHPIAKNAGGTPASQNIAAQAPCVGFPPNCECLLRTMASFLSLRRARFDSYTGHGWSCNPNNLGCGAGVHAWGMSRSLREQPAGILRSVRWPRLLYATNSTFTNPPTRASKRPRES